MQCQRRADILGGADREFCESGFDKAWRSGAIDWWEFLVIERQN